MKRIAFLVLATLIFGCTSFAPAEKTRLELRLVASGPGGPDFSEMRTFGASEPVFVSNIPVITERRHRSRPSDEVRRRAGGTLTFTKMAANKFCDITSANIGKPMSVLVDGKLVNVATIRERFCGPPGRALITGNFSVEEAKRIAAAFPDGPADAVAMDPRSALAAKSLAEAARSIARKLPKGIIVTGERSGEVVQLAAAGKREHPGIPPNG